MSSATSWTGYAAPAAGRCSFEPAAGAFYRTVTASNYDRLGSIVIVRDLQFLSGGTPTSPAPLPQTPRATYDSAHAVTNNPPSSQVGVTVSVVFTARGTTKVRSVFSQIQNHDAGPTLVKTKVDAQAVQITSMAPDGATEVLSGGVLSLAGSVGDISSADVEHVGGRRADGHGRSDDEPVRVRRRDEHLGATIVLSLAPVDVTPNWGGPCTALLCYGTSRVASDLGPGVLTDDALPKVGSSGSPLRASITDTTASALRFDNVGAAPPRGNWSNGVVRLVGSAPGVSTLPAPTACPGGPGASARLSGAGYIDTTLHGGSQTLRDTAACASTRSAAIGILPTPWAPDGILKVTINRSFAWCTVTGGTASGGVGLSATVEVSDGNGGYQAQIPAQDFLLATAKISDARGMVTGYVSGWTYGAGATPNAVGGQVSADVPGVKVTTVPTRFKSDGTTVDPDSAVIVTLGAASCASRSNP